MEASTIELVRRWHEAFGVENAECVRIDVARVNNLRVELLIEELAELRAALAELDPVEVLDALTDLQFVLDGAYLAFGMAEFKDAAFIEVWRSNMSKLGADGNPIRRADGKVLKGPDFREPDLRGVLEGRVTAGIFEGGAL